MTSIFEGQYPQNKAEIPIKTGVISGSRYIQTFFMYIFLSLSFSSSCDLLICEACPFSTLVDLEILGFMGFVDLERGFHPTQRNGDTIIFIYVLYIYTYDTHRYKYICIFFNIFIYVIHVFQTTPPPFLGF